MINPIYIKMLQALNETFVMMGIAVVFAVVIGLPVGCILFVARKRGLNPHRLTFLVTSTYVNVVRSFPFLILVIILIPVTRMIVGTGFGTRASAVPLSLIAIALYARMVEQSLLDVNSGPIEATVSMGANTWQVLRYVVLVEARSSLILGLTSVVISLLSYSTVMGVIGGGGLGDFAMLYGYQGNRLDLMIIAVIVLIIIVQSIQMFGTYFARRLDKKQIKEYIR